MSPPTIAAYLVEFDAALEARLGRRRRIVLEIEDHLREAAAAGLERGLDPADAEAAAIADFGDPVSVAEAFGGDPVARVTTRLVVVGHRLDVWMAQHPWRGAALAATVPGVFYVIGATGGVLFNRIPAYTIPVSALEPFPLTFLFWGVLARSLRARPERGLWARATAAGKGVLFLCQYYWWLGVGGLTWYHEMVGRRDVWDAGFRHAFLGLVAAGGGLFWLLQAIIRKRNRSTTDGEDWADHHPSAEVIPVCTGALTFAWLVILAFDARSPLSIRLPMAVIVALSASFFWLCRGSISSRKARIVFHDGLMSSEQQTRE
jgi:hypothetical protein